MYNTKHPLYCTESDVRMIIGIIIMLLTDSAVEGRDEWEV